MSRAYRVLTGLNYPIEAAYARQLARGEAVARDPSKERRAEPGDVVTDLPAQSIAWLLEQGHIEPLTDLEDAP